MSRSSCGGETLESTEERGDFNMMRLLGKKLLLPALGLIWIMAIVACAGQDHDGLVLGGMADEDKVAALIERQAHLWNQRDWQALYELKSPRTREVCSYKEYLEKVQSTQAQLRAFVGDGDLSVRAIEVAVREDAAAATYVLQMDGADLGVVEDDLFISVEGRWFDIDEDATPCPRSDEAALIQGLDH